MSSAPALPSLPVAAAPAPAPAVSSAAAAGTTPANAGGAQASSTAVSSQDFLLMLGQLLGATAPTPAAAAQAGPAVVTTDAQTDTAETLDGAALDAMLSFTPLTPWTATPVLLPQTAAADAISSTGINALLPGGGSARGVIDALTANLDQLTTADGTDAAAFANSLTTAATPTDTTQDLRATTSSDTAARGLHTPVGSSEWADELGTRLTWMAERGGHQTASLKLSPEHLGPLEVRISIRDDQASVWFGAAHADTRSAIEQALPRLRELFGMQGLTLADTGVFREAPRDQSQSQPAPTTFGDAAQTSEGEGTVISIAHRRLGLVDAYA